LQVVLAPDPDLAEHLLLHGVMLNHTSYEGDRLQRAFLIQVRAHAYCTLTARSLPNVELQQEFNVHIMLCLSCQKLSTATRATGCSGLSSSR
jgi:hypothetical protein